MLELFFMPENLITYTKKIEKRKDKNNEHKIP